jgi:hypothetical protein
LNSDGTLVSNFLHASTCALSFSNGKTYESNGGVIGGGTTGAYGYGNNGYGYQYGNDRYGYSDHFRKNRNGRKRVRYCDNYGNCWDDDTVEVEAIAKE